MQGTGILFPEPFLQLTTYLICPYIWGLCIAFTDVCVCGGGDSGGSFSYSPTRVLPFYPHPLAAYFSCFRKCSNGLPQSLSMDIRFLQWPNGQRRHKSSASHFDWTDFCIPFPLGCVCCQLCVSQFLALIGLLHRDFTVE